MAKILAIAEHRNGKLTDASLELCKAAKAIASALGAEPAAAVMGKDDSIAKEVAKYIPTVFSVSAPALDAHDGGILHRIGLLDDLMGDPLDCLFDRFLVQDTALLFYIHTLPRIGIKNPAYLFNG